MKKTKAICLIAVLTVSALLLSTVNTWAVSEEAKRHFDRGVAAVEMAKSPDDYAAAIKEFEQAIRFAPDWPDVYYNLGMVQEKAGKYRDAITSLKQYLRLAPNASDAEPVKSLVNKLEYKAEQVLTVPEIIDVLVSFSDHQNWQQYDGECIYGIYKTCLGCEAPLTREGYDVVKVLTVELRAQGGHKSYKTLKVTGPTLKYISTINICDAYANRELGGCDEIIENEMEVVSKTLVKITQKVIRGGPLGSIYRDRVGDKFSCKYRKK